MARRALAVAGWLPFAACCYAYGVQRSATPAAALDGQALQHAVEAMADGASLLPWDGSALTVSFARGAATVELWYSGDAATGELVVASTWWNRLPDEATLRASLALQDELLHALARAVPGFPAAAAFHRTWIGQDAPLGGPWAARIARLDATVAP